MSWGAGNIAAASVEDQAIFHTWLFEIVSATIELRLFVGSGADLQAFGEIFTAEDETYGAIGEMDQFSESLNMESPRPDISIVCPSDLAAVALTDALDPDTTVKVWLAFISPLTGQPVAPPEIMFDGFVDVPYDEADHDVAQVRMECVTFAERFHDRGEGHSMNSASHQGIRPGELGFDLINDDKPRYWGGEDPHAPIPPQQWVLNGVLNGVLKGSPLGGLVGNGGIKAPNAGAASVSPLLNVLKAGK